MIIDLRTITEEPRRFSITLERDWWSARENDDQILGLEAPLKADIEIYRAGDKFVLEGRIEGRVIARCDRCLESFELDSRSRFESFFSLPVNDPSQREMELAEADMEVDYIEEIDLNEIIREQIYLSIPVKLICRPECRGLCPRCGINLNAAQCQCRQDTGHPGFAKLKNMKIQGE